MSVGEVAQVSASDARSAGSVWPGAIGAGGDDAVLDRLRHLEGQLRQTYSAMLEAVAELQGRGVAAQRGFGTTWRMLAGMCQLSAGEAKQRVAHAELLGSRVAVTGQELEPQLPVTAAGLASGEIGLAQLRVITGVIEQIPVGQGTVVVAETEARLAEHASQLSPMALRRLGSRILSHLDPDGPEPDSEIAPAPAGRLVLRDRRDGGVGFEGWLGPEHGPALRELVGWLGAPRAPGPGIPDPRSPEQRHADGLAELCGLARSAAQAPTAAGEPPHLTVTVSLADLRTGEGAAALDYGSYLTAGELRRWACDARVIPLVLGTDSEPLDVGRSSRSVPRGMRRAVVTRDRYCVFPGCARSPAQCEVHHIIHWAEGGPTELNNLCLLCEHHHRYIHATGWDAEVRGGGVQVRPPSIIDPERRPLTNPLRE